MSTPSFQYCACPACGHPNVHTQDGRLKAHYPFIGARGLCAGSDMRTPIKRDKPIERGSYIHAKERARVEEYNR